MGFPPLTALKMWGCFIHGKFWKPEVCIGHNGHDKVSSTITPNCLDFAPIHLWNSWGFCWRSDDVFQPQHGNGVFDDSPRTNNFWDQCEDNNCKFSDSSPVNDCKKIFPTGLAFSVVGRRSLWSFFRGWFDHVKRQALRCSYGCFLLHHIHGGIVTGTVVISMVGRKILSFKLQSKSVISKDWYEYIIYGYNTYRLHYHLTWPPSGQTSFDLCLREHLNHSQQAPCDIFFPLKRRPLLGA